MSCSPRNVAIAVTLFAICSLLVVLAFTARTWHSIQQKFEASYNHVVLQRQDPINLRNTRTVSRMFRDLRLLKQSNMAIHPLLDGRIAGDGLVVIDVGANSGNDYSRPALDHGFKIYSFEPIPDVWGAFVGTMGGPENEKLTIVDVYPGQMALMPEGHYLPDMNHCFFIKAAASNETSRREVRSQNEMSSLVDQSFYADGGMGKFVTISTVRIDDVVGDQDIFLFKIDTQGYEYFVLEGADALLRRNKVAYLTLEFWPEGIRRSGVEPLELLRKLHGLGFTCYDVSDNKTPDGTKHVREQRSSDFAGYIAELMRMPSAGNFIGLWDELFCTRDENDPVFNAAQKLLQIQKIAD